MVIENYIYNESDSLLYLPLSVPRMSVKYFLVLYPRTMKLGLEHHASSALFG